MSAHSGDLSNQSPPYEDVDLFASDRPLQDAVRANGAAGECAALSTFGRRWGSAAMFGLGRAASEHPPALSSGGATQHSVVAFDPAYHRLMAESIAEGLQATTWREDATPAPVPAQVARAARFYMVAQVETGHLCPITMTRAAVAALTAEPELIERLMPKIVSRDYDERLLPWTEKRGITLGMGMTERQGGTDVRSNTTRAVASGEGYSITGHKWFMSAPMCDGFLVLAQAPSGLTCFLMPRFRPDGAINALHFQRLKDKLGNRSNASSEVEFDNAFAWRVGAEGRGIATIIQMVQLTRLDCAIASAGLMRMALAQALHHARHRRVFQRRLVDQPMMQTVLADMAIDVEAATALTMRLCRSFDHAINDSREAVRARLLTPAAKFWVCKTAPGLIYEAMECLGGNGYVEDSLLPRLYREAPVNAIWEGAGNVMALDVLRAFAREGEGARDVVATLALELRDLPGVREAVDHLQAEIARTEMESDARHMVETMALLAAAAALRDGAPPAVAELFARTRLAARRGSLYGTVTIEPAEAAAMLDRALPA